MVAYDKHVTLIIQGQNTKVDGFVPWDIIYDVTSYMAQGYRFSPRFRMGHWDGRKKLFSRQTRTFPSGLTSTVQAALEKHGIAVTIEDQRDAPPPPDLGTWLQDINLHGVSFGYPYDYQPKVADAMLRNQRGIVAVATNGGKTEIACLVTAALRAPTLFMVPGKELLYQTAERFRKRLGLSEEQVGWVGDGVWKPGTWITVGTAATLSRGLKKAKVRDLLETIDVVFADECFPAGTLVGDRPIEDLREGDLVPSFDEHTGKFAKRRVVRRFVNRPSSLVRVWFGSRSLACTPGHPFWTQRGWVPAAALTSDDMVLCSTQKQEVGDARPLLEMWNEDRKNSRSRHSSLRELQEVIEENGYHGLCRVREGSHAFLEASISSSQEGASLLLRPVQGNLDSTTVLGSNDANQQPPSRFDLETYAGTESYARPASQSKDAHDASGYGMAAPCAWWERHGPHSSRTVVSVNTGLGHWDSHSHQAASGLWLPDQLQSGRSERGFESSCRNRWRVPLFSREAGSRSKERRSAQWVGVDSLEVLEPGCDGTFSGVCPDGLVYNIEVEGTHTYLAEGVVVHNCHHAASDSWYKVLRACGAFYRFGLSGTPLKRSDGADLRLIGVTGDVIYEIRNKYLIERGISNNVEIQFLKVTEPKGIPKGTPWDDVYKLGIVENTHRHTELCRRVAEFVAQGKQCVMMVKELEHGRQLSAHLDSSITHKFINGKESSDVRRNAIKDYVNGDLQVLIVTSILDQGVDIPNIDVLVPAGGGKSSIKTLQRVGRGIRRGGSSDCLIVLETADLTHRYLTEHSLQRMKDYKEEECFAINVL